MDINITATIDDQTGHYVFSVPTSPRFTRLSSAIGWATLDSQHALVVGGETVDNRIIVFHEFVGQFTELVDEIVDIKDRLLLDELWIDVREKGLHRQLHDIDGLTRYISYGLDFFNQPIWEQPASNWTWFRDRETVIQLCAVPRDLYASARYGMDLVITMVKMKQLAIHESCTQCAWILDQQNIGDIIKDPISRAISSLVNALVAKKGQDETRPYNPYPNLRG